MTIDILIQFGLNVLFIYLFILFIYWIYHTKKINTLAKMTLIDMTNKLHVTGERREERTRLSSHLKPNPLYIICAMLTLAVLFYRLCVRWPLLPFTIALLGWPIVSCPSVRTAKMIFKACTCLCWCSLLLLCKVDLPPFTSTSFEWHVKASRSLKGRCITICTLCMFFGNTH